MVKRIISLNLLKTGDGDFIEVLKSSFWAFLALGVATGVHFIFELLLARFFGAELFGIYYLVFSVVTVLALFGRLGFDRALVRFVPPLLAKKDFAAINGLKRSAIRLSLFVSLPLSILVFILAPYIATTVFNTPEVTGYLRLFCLAIPSFALVYIYSGLLRGLKLSKESIIVERGLVYGLGIVVVTLSYYAFNAAALFVGMVVATYLTALFGEVLVRTRVQSSLYIEKINKKLLVKTGLPLLFVIFAAYMTGHLNIMLLGALADPESVGIFSAAFKVSMLMTLVLTAINTISAAKISELYYAGKNKQFENIVSKTAALSATLGLPIFLVLVLFSSQVLSLFGQEFIAGSTVLIILASAQMVDLSAGSNAYILSMTGYERVQAMAIGVVLILNLILGVVLIPRLGINGAAIAASASIIARNLIFISLIKRYLNVWSLPFNGMSSWLKRVLSS